ncbi:GNAT family N-acetyltransferase [Chitinophaga sp. Hz27]|uniref:GNAT family N-acetyltransferase n=1 Tax=Chitinophaga sp. Hz27 TaxID=3347169 RepID=UPI0035E26309
MITLTHIRIRDHYKIMADMLHQLHLSEKEYFPATAAWEDIADNYMQHVIEMQEEYEGTCIVAWDRDKPVGFIFAYLEYPDESRIEDYTGDTLYVSDGYVAPDYRQMGIYRSMNEDLENKYIAQGIRRMVRYTLTNNKRMQAFLTSKNYTAVRLVYEKWLTPDGQEPKKIF